MNFDHEKLERMLIGNTIGSFITSLAFMRNRDPLLFFVIVCLISFVISITYVSIPYFYHKIKQAMNPNQ